MDPNDVMGGVRDLLAARLKEPGAELVVPRPLPVVLADDVRLTEVLTNLVGNALKYTQGDVRVEVGYLDPSVDLSEGEGLTMYVKGDGIGIPAQHHEAVFRLFKRLHGREVLRRVRSLEQHAALPIVVLTTSADPGDVQTCYQSGANSYLIKPVDLGQFMQMMSAFAHYWTNITSTRLSASRPV